MLVLAPVRLKVPALVKVAPAPVSPPPWLEAEMLLDPPSAVQMLPSALTTLPWPASAVPVARLFRSTEPLCVSVPSLRNSRPPSSRSKPLIVVAPCTVVMPGPEWPAMLANAAAPLTVRLPLPVTWPLVWFRLAKVALLVPKATVPVVMLLVPAKL